MTFRDIDFKGYLPVVLLFAQTQWVTWDLRAMYRITLGQKNLAALFQRLWGHGAHGGWLLLHHLIRNCRAGPGPWQGRRGEGLSLPSCPKSAARALEGLGTPAVGMACWLWRVVACQGLGFGMLQRHKLRGYCHLAPSTLHPCPQSCAVAFGMLEMPPHPQCLVPTWVSSRVTAGGQLCHYTAVFFCWERGEERKL